MSFEKIFLICFIVVSCIVFYYFLLKYLIEYEEVNKFIKDYEIFKKYLFLNYSFHDLDDFILFKLREYNFTLYKLKLTKYRSLRKRLNKIEIVDFAIFKVFK